LQEEVLLKAIKPRKKKTEKLYQLLFDEINSIQAEELGSSDAFTKNLLSFLKRDVTQSVGNLFIARFTTEKFFLGITMRHLSSAFYEPPVQHLAVRLSHLVEKVERVAKWIAASRLPAEDEITMRVFMLEVQFWVEETGLGKEIRGTRTVLSERLHLLYSMRSLQVSINQYQAATATDAGGSIAVVKAWSASHILAKHA